MIWKEEMLIFDFFVQLVGAMQICPKLAKHAKSRKSSQTYAWDNARDHEHDDCADQRDVDYCNRKQVTVGQ